MSDLYIEPSRRHIDSTDRSDADSGGGGTSFVFIGGEGRGGNEEKEEEKKKKPVDFGQPVEIELSSKVLYDEDATALTDAEEDEEENAGDENNHHHGGIINITI